MDLYKELAARIAGEIASDPHTRSHYSEDRSPFQIIPSAVVFPKHSRDIRTIVQFVARHKKQFPQLSITARAAGTDVTGGPLGNSIILDVSRHCTHAHIFTQSATAITEPGLHYADFERRARAYGLQLPSFPASARICALGGMVANNAGGEQTLKYGKTDRYVSHLRVVLSDGVEYLFEPVSGAKLKHKLELHSFEGEIYRAVYRLATKNHALLERARPRVSKNSAGYALWNIWNPDTGVFDLTKLFVGSQGTLGVITEIGLRLVHPQPHRRMLVIFLKDITTLPAAVTSTLKFGPESFEMYDKSVFKIMLRLFPQFYKLFHRNLLGLIKDFIPEMLVMARLRALPEFILTAQFAGDSPAAALAAAQSVQKALKKLGIYTHLTGSAAETRKYQTIRRESFSVLQQHSRGLQTVTFIDDLIVPPEKWPQFIPRLRAELDKYPNLVYAMFGHIGDGNLHVVPLMDLSNPTARDTIERLTKKINALVLSLGGSITAEHNDGLIRSPFLRDMYGDEVYALMRRIKRLFDPQNIFNPNKKIDADFSVALDHLKHKL